MCNILTLWQRNSSYVEHSSAPASYHPWVVVAGKSCCMRERNRSDRVLGLELRGPGQLAS